MDLTPQPDYKCKLCGFAQTRHAGVSKACPLSSGRNPQFHMSQTFETSGQMTVASQRRINEYKEYQKELIAREFRLQTERNKVRAMTFEEVITLMVERLSEKTGLGIVVERESPRHVLIHVTNLGGAVRLGYTSVSINLQDGSYIIGGVRSGCFMYNTTEGISYVMAHEFEQLENKANAEKV